VLLQSGAEQLQLAKMTANNAVVNNRALHPSERALAQHLADKSEGKYTVEEIEAQMRLMGKDGKAPGTVEVLTTPKAIEENVDNDPNMPKLVSGTAVVEVMGAVDMQIQQFIVNNAQPADIPSIYTMSKVSTTQPTGAPVSNTVTTRCANGDMACITGVGRQQNAPLTQQAREAIADGASSTSRASGVVAAGATTLATQMGPYGRLAKGVAVGATVIGTAADVVEYIAQPNPQEFIKEQIGLGMPAAVLAEKFPLWAPIINEVSEEIKKGIKN
jgi:filamentous hemagglutinin